MFSNSSNLSKFYQASNSLLRAVKRLSGEVMMHLIYSCCIPILSYASPVKGFPLRQMQECSTAINDALRFNQFNRWESVRSLREQFGYTSLIEIFHISENIFEASLLTHQNTVVRHLARNIKLELEKDQEQLMFLCSALCIAYEFFFSLLKIV